MVEVPALDIDRPAQSAGVSLRGNLALHHLYAACRFTSIVAQVERDNAGRPLGAFWEEILHNSLGVAALTVTFLDSYADDLCQERGSLVPRQAEAGHLPAPTGGILGKYAAALNAHAGKGLDYSLAAVQNVDALIRLRNEVVSMRTEWPDPLGQHGMLAERLQARFAPSAFFPGEAVLPRAWASHSFASWALRSTVEFLDYVYAEAGMPSPVARLKSQMSGPCGSVLRDLTAGAPVN